MGCELLAGKMWFTKSASIFTCNASELYIVYVVIVAEKRFGVLCLPEISLRCEIGFSIPHARRKATCKNQKKYGEKKGVVNLCVEKKNK